MRFLTLAFGLPLVAACCTAPHESGVIVRVTVSASRIEVGQPDTIVVTTTNATDHAVSLTFPSSCQVSPFIRRAGEGIVLPQGGDWVCEAVVTSLQLRPGESKRQAYVWGGHASWLGQLPMDALPPGDYEVYAELRANELRTTAPAVSVRLD